MIKNLRTSHSSKNKQLYKETVLFSLIYSVFFVVVILPVLLKNGFILGGDGYNMYYPSLLNFRRTLLEFFQNIKNGSFEFPMMNFNYGFGVDNYTMLASQISFFPCYVFCVFLPESCMASFLMVPVFLLDYFAGISFLRMCHYFLHHTCWNSLMAAAYCLSSIFFTNYVFNPHFMNMLVAFPLMVVGMDRVIQKRGWRLLCICTFWLSLTSFTLLIYILPFLALFAIIRIAFLYKSGFLSQLFKVVFRSIPVLLTGFLLSGIVQLPIIYLLKNSARSVGNQSIDFASLFIPELSRISRCFVSNPFNNTDEISALPAFIAVPGMLLLLLVVSKRKELRTYMLAIIVCIAFPVIDCGLNGFQYCLIRWGAVPALVFSFAASVGMSELPKLERKKSRRMIYIAFIFGVLCSLELPCGFKGENICALLIVIASICRMVPLLCRLWAYLCQSAKKSFTSFIAALKDKSASVRHYLSFFLTVVGGACLLWIVLTTILFPDYHFDVRIIVCSVALILMSALTMLKKEHATFGIKVFGVALTISMVVVNLEFAKRSYNLIKPISFYQMSQELEHSRDSFNRVLFVSYFPEIDEMLGWINRGIIDDLQEEDNIEDLNNQISSNSFDYDWRDNYGLGTAVPDSAFFYNMIDNDLYSTLVRCGQGISDFPSMTCVMGYGHKEVLYTLFGINHFGTEDNKLNDYGMKEVYNRLVDGRKCRIYDYSYDLPVGITYDSYISKETANKASSSEYPYVLLNYAFIEAPDKNEITNTTDKELPSYCCDIVCDKVYHSTNFAGMKLYDHHIIVNGDTSNCFFYFEVNGVDARFNVNTNEISTRFTINSTEKRKYTVSNFDNQWPWTRRADHYSFALGYFEEGVNTIDVRLPMKYDELHVYAIPASLLTKGYEARCSEVLKNVSISTNLLEGDIELSSDKLLSVGLIHNDGWSVEVDGEPATLYKVNGLFIGTQLAKGNHHIRFVYHTAWLNIGIICTAFGILMWIMMELITRRKSSESKEI